MNDERTRRSSKAAASAAILVALPLLYVLSVGPVFYLLDVTQWSWRHPRLMKSIVTMYSPLRPLFEYPFLGPPFQRYTQWWLELPNESLMRSDLFFPLSQMSKTSFWSRLKILLLSTLSALRFRNQNKESPASVPNASAYASPRSFAALHRHRASLCSPGVLQGIQ